MTRTKSLALLLVFVLIGAAFIDWRVSTFGVRLATVQHHLATVQQHLATVQNQLLVSQKASTQTRVTTVGQRCDLTRLILGVLVRVHDTEDAAPFHASLKVCRNQLILVKRINTQTPLP